MAKRGPKSKISETVKAAIKSLALEGKTISQIASMMNLGRSTVYNWMQDDPELLDALKVARADADESVERSLWERANGYSCEAVKIFYDKDRGECIEHKYIQHYPPDPTSMIFWLKNRQPDKWREKTEFDQTQPIVIKFDSTDEKA